MATQNLPQNNVTHNNPTGSTSHKNTFIYFGLGIVFIIAAALNYDALRSFAHEQAEVNYWLSFGVPILVDTFIAIAVYITLKNKVIGESTTLAWSIVIAFTVASIYLNSLHYPANIYGWSMAGLVPLVVFFSAELAKQQMEIKHKWDDTLKTIKQLTSDRDIAQNELDTLHNERAELAQQLETERTRYTAQIAQYEQQTANLHTEIEQLLQQRKQAQTQIVSASDIPITVLQAVQLDALIAAGKTKSSAADMVKVGRNTVNNRLQLVNGQSLIEGAI